MLGHMRALVVVALTCSVAGAGWAQDIAASTGTRSPTQVGTVLSTEGPQGAVIVVRGSQAYFLVSGDFLFEGDRIVTRSNGAAKISANGCEKTLNATSSIVVNNELCDVAPVQLANAEATQELALTPASAPAPPPGVGATPFVLPGLVAAGATAAAVAGSNNTSRVVQ